MSDMTAKLIGGVWYEKERHSKRGSLKEHL